MNGHPIAYMGSTGFVMKKAWGMGRRAQGEGHRAKGAEHGAWSMEQSVEFRLRFGRQGDQEKWGHGDS